MKNTVHKVRPAARLIRTIGEELIKDDLAAIIELVKNSYDADSKDVEIIFDVFDAGGQKVLVVKIKDHGHGMSYETVVNKWLVPATSDKLSRRYSPKGRVLQGRKGIGRYASAILGEQLFLDTIDEFGENTKILIDWSDFEKKEFLEDVEILVETGKTSKRSGTVIELKKYVQDYQEVLQIWPKKHIEKLLIELRKLISPLDTGTEDEFIISLLFKEFPNPDYNNRDIEIEPFPLLDLYDYRISGSVDDFGNARLSYENQCIRGGETEKIELKISTETDSRYCGHVCFDFRVYDKDPPSIDDLISRGLKDPTSGRYLGKREARKLIEEFAGVGVYRGDFRIRPYGDAYYDWLELNRQRVQNPSFKVGTDQVIGIIKIKGEEDSGLKEKSARDGLVENSCYHGLQDISREILKLLEARRFKFRQITKRSRKRKSLSEEIKEAFEFKTVEERIFKEFDHYNIPREKAEELADVIRQATEDKKETIKEIEEKIAMYEGQATLGKIVMILLHEGRKPISYLNEQLPRISKWVTKFVVDPTDEMARKIKDRMASSEENIHILSRLFNKIEPLSVTRSPRIKNLDLNLCVKKTALIFESEIQKKRIVLDIGIPLGMVVYARESDVYTVFTNLIENSIYWMTTSNSVKRTISINADNDKDIITVDYYDSGPGIDIKYIQEEVIFEPGFSLKTGGTGLGLALAGEALNRNNGKIYALPNAQGAHFRMTLSTKEIS